MKLTGNYLAGDFIVSAGSVLFRRVRPAPSPFPSQSPSTSTITQQPAADTSLEICILHDIKRNRWLLPKGRQDVGEDLRSTAVRETYEESGWCCTLLPLYIPTRATEPGVGRAPDAAVLRWCTEAIALSTFDRGAKGVKLVYWYVTRVFDDVVKEEGTQMPGESYVSHFLPADEAVGMLTADAHRDVAALAVRLVRSTEGALSREVV